MLNLSLNDIQLNNKASNKQEAIKLVAQKLVEENLVEENYVAGMLAREQQTSTYLGKGVAIPHGTVETRQLVKKTGVQILHFPQGILWGDDKEVAYTVIGIAAHSDEHLSLLRHLTHLLNGDELESQLANIKDKETLLSILLPHQSNKLSISVDLIKLDVDTDSMITLQALNAGLLKQHGAVNKDYINHIINQSPQYLGEGIWLNDSEIGNINNAIALSRPKKSFMFKNKQVTILISAAITSQSTQPFFDNLAEAIIQKNITPLLTNNKNALIDYVKSWLSPSHQDTMHEDTTAEQAQKSLYSIHNTSITADFIIPNEHGLHARPSSLLIKTIKPFDSSITISNLDGENTAVNGKNLMNLVSLGAQKGHRLRFVVTGHDAKQAIEAIANAVQNGLGEPS